MKLIPITEINSETDILIVNAYAGRLASRDLITSVTSAPFLDKFHKLIVPTENPNVNLFEILRIK